MSNPDFHDADCRDTTGFPLGRLLDVLALGTVLVFAWRACSGRHRHRRSARSARAPAAVHTWEGEGGRPVHADDD